MPVGYNIAANTYLPDPLTTTKGKALRSGIKTEELLGQKYEQEIEFGPAREDRQERRVVVEEEQERRLREEFEAMQGTEEGEALNEYMNVTVAAYEQAKVDNLSDEEANAFAWEAGLDHADRIYPGSRDAAAKKLGGSGFSPESFDVRKMRSFLGERPATESAKQHVNYKLPDGSIVAARPNSQEANAIVAQGGIVAGTSDKVLGLGGAEGAIESKDSALIMRAVHAGFGGLFDDDNQIIPLKPNIARKAQRVGAEAEKIFIAAKGGIGQQTAADIARDQFDRGLFGGKQRASADVEIPVKMQKQITNAWIDEHGKPPTYEEMQSVYKKYLESQE